MTTLGTLKSAVAAYMQQTTDYFVQNGVDLILQELNSARQTAEKLYSFNHNQAEFELSVDPDLGTSIDSAVIVEPEPWQVGAKVKDVETFYLVNDDGLAEVPLFHHSKKMVAVQLKERYRRRTLNNPRYRYPGDAGSPLVNNNQTTVMMNGRLVSMHPKSEETVTLRFDAQIWMPDYTDDDNYTDWMIQYGTDYLKYSAIVALNYFTNTFVASDESVGPPVKMAEQALGALVAWDASFMMAGRQIRTDKV